jgi:hypothetical protein
LPIQEDEEPLRPNNLTRYGRAILWRIVCELVRRYPGPLSMGETWVHTGQNRCIVVSHEKASRDLLFDVPHPPGDSMGMIGYLPAEEAFQPLGEFSWQPILGDWSRASDPRMVLDNLAGQLLLGPRKGIGSTRPHTLIWRAVAAFMTQAITGRRTWDLVAGNLHHGGSEGRRDNLLEAYPQAYDAARGLGSSDPATETWFLVSDPTGVSAGGYIPKASMCLVPATGQVWLADGEGGGSHGPLQAV